MSTKRLRNSNDQNNNDAESDSSLDHKILASDINEIIQAHPSPASYPYHTSACGSLLYSTPSKSSEEIFGYLRHGNFDALRRSLDVYHQDIILMRNAHGQSVLHNLVIQAYPYLWVRLLMMRGCDTCAQDLDGYTAAHYAIERDDVEMLKALTVRFQSPSNPIPEQQVNTIHQQCLNALAKRENRGLTAFMLACHRNAIKCLNYLLSLNINDSHLQDNYGDTCLHYAVARRQQDLIEKLIETCQANVNGGNPTRPSVLDILQFNRQYAKATEQGANEQIERYLLSHGARNRCTIRRMVNKRKTPEESNQPAIPNLSSLSLELTTDGDLETARSHARLAATLAGKGDSVGAKESYENAMKYSNAESIEWTDYAYHLALLHQTTGQKQIALELLEKALEVRLKCESEGENIDRFRQAIEMIQRNAS